MYLCCRMVWYVWASGLRFIHVESKRGHYAGVDKLAFVRTGGTGIMEMYERENEGRTWQHHDIT